jgi:hypothetical protein
MYVDPYVRDFTPLMPHWLVYDAVKMENGSRHSSDMFYFLGLLFIGLLVGNSWSVVKTSSKIITENSWIM